MNPVRCPKCGKINDGTTYFCIYCGTIFEDYKEEDIELPKIFTRENFNETEEKLKNTEKLNQDNSLNQENQDQFNQFNQFDTIPKKRKHTLAIILGYFFSIMGGLIGFIIAIYLITREDPNAKKHGKIQLGILIFWLIVMGILIWTGAMDYHMLLTPMNLTSMQNMSGINNSADLNNLLTYP